MTADFDQLKEWFKESADHHSDWREEAELCYAFVAGDQWDLKDRTILVDMQRPVITFNRVGAVVDSVSGLEVNNRQETRFIPREVGDAPVNEVLTSAGDWARDECDAEDEESEGFYDMVVCGVGDTETRMDYDQDPEGMAVIERVDPLEIYWDAASRKKNYMDARHVFRVKELPLDEAKTLAPDAEEADLHAAWASDALAEVSKPHDADEAPFYRNQADVENRKTVRLVEAQWWEYGVAWDVLDPATGQLVRATAEEWAKLQRRLRKMGQEPPKAVQRRSRIYKRALLGSKVLKEWPGPKEGGFTLKAMTAKRDRNKGTWYGLVRGMMDPQRWANKWLSQTLHIINTNAKGGTFAERDAMDDPQQFEQSYARSDAVTYLKSGGIGKIKDKPQTQYPAGIDRLMQFAVSSIRDVPGVNLELLGMADRQQPGILEAERKRAGMTILAGMFDALRRYRKEQGRLLLWYIRTFLSDGRLIRIGGEEQAKYVPLVRQEGVARYDVIVDDTPASPNVKERTWAALTQLMPFLAKMPIAPAIWLELLKYSPLPSSLVSKIGELGSEAQQPSPQQQLAEQAAQAKIELDRAKAAHERAEANATQQGASVEVAEAVSGIAAEQAGAAQRNLPGEFNGIEQPDLPFSAPSPAVQAAQMQAEAARAQVQAAQMQVQSNMAIAEALKQLAAATAAPRENEIVRGTDGRAVGTRSRIVWQ